MEADDSLRFQQELEFVCALASTSYLEHLAHQGYFEDDAFNRYLAYLQYWRTPAYAKYVPYPLALHVLALLQRDAFRAELAKPAFAAELNAHIVNGWMEGRRDKWRGMQEEKEQEEKELPKKENE